MEKQRKDASNKDKKHKDKKKKKKEKKKKKKKSGKDKKHKKEKKSKAKRKAKKEKSQKKHGENADTDTGDDSQSDMAALKGGKKKKNSSPSAESDEEEDAQVEASGLSICRTPATDDDLQLRGFQDLLEKAISVDPEKGVFLDFYAGAGKSAARAESKYGMIGVAIDIQKHPAWNLHTPGVVPYIRTKVRSGRVKAGHLATECSTFSSARHGKKGGTCPLPLRDYGENAWGFPDLCEKDRATLEKGNKDARLTLELIDLFIEYRVPISVENGDSSILWHLPEMKERLTKARIFKVDYCMMGRDYRKRTRLATWGLKNTHLALRLQKQCQEKYHCLSKNSICCRTQKPHTILRGWARGKALSAQGRAYPRKFANLITQLLLG